jgi:hypothetical protein
MAVAHPNDACAEQGPAIGSGPATAAGDRAPAARDRRIATLAACDSDRDGQRRVHSFAERLRGGNPRGPPRGRHGAEGQGDQ